MEDPYAGLYLLRMRLRFFMGVSLLSCLPLQGEEKVTFDEQIFPIFQQACLNCHNPEKAKGGLDLSTYAASIKGGSGGKIVEPGDVNCVLIGSITHTSEKKMPPEGDKLATAQIETIKRWIEGGLLENKTSAARKTSKPKFQMALRSNPAVKPEGPPPMPVDVLLEPIRVSNRPTAVHSLATSPWAPLLAVTGQRQVMLHSTVTLELLGILPFPEGDPVSLAFTPEGRYLIVGGGVPGKSGLTVTYDVTNGSRLLSVGKEFDSVLAADIRPGFDRVATGGPSRLLKIWRTDTGELFTAIKKHTDWITALDISNDGVLLASGDRNGGVWVWECESGNEFQTLRGHQAGITAIGFRADSNILGTASEDGTVRFWEMNNGSEVKKLDAHAGGVTAFAFGKDGTSVTAGRDLKVKLWKPDFNAARELANDLPALPTAVALDFQGKVAFVADAQGVIRSYQTDDGKILGEFRANPPTIQARLESLAETIPTCQHALAEAQKIVIAKNLARETAKQALMDAEKSHQGALEIHKTAQAEVQTVQDEAHAALAKAALSNIQMAEQTVSIKRAEMTAAEKAALEAKAAEKNCQAELAVCKAELKHWQAARINTQILEAKRQHAEAMGSLEAFRQEFNTAVHSVASWAEYLNLKRAERQWLIQQIHHPAAPEVKAELQATMAAMDIRMDAAVDSLQKAETETLHVKDALEATATRLQMLSSEAASLQICYRKALE